MKKLVHSIAALLMGLALCSPAAMAVDIDVVHSGSWPPYAGQDLPEQGLAIDIVTTALQRAGYNPRVRTATLTEILEGTRTGVYDVFATPWYTLERSQYLDFSQPYLESSIQFIKRKDTAFEYTRFDDLETVKIGVIEGYAYDEDFNESTAIEKIGAGSLEANLRKLLAGDIDLSLDDALVLSYTLNRSMQERAADLQILARPLVVRGVNIGVSRKNPDHARIVTAFDKAIAEMKQDGTHQRIVEKHRRFIEQPIQP